MAEYTKENRLKMLRNEISDIKDEKLRVFAESLVAEAPDYFFTCPASSTGKYHPTLSLGEGGLVRHTRLVVWFAEQIATAMMLDDYSKDLLVVSAIAHDIQKHGDGNTKYTVKEHPKLAAEFVEKTWTEMAKEDRIAKKTLFTIEGIVSSHMGQWGEKDGMPLPETNMELILHTADYLAARKEIASFTFRETEETEKVAENPSDYRLTFGKHSGRTLGEFYKEDKDEAENYFNWILGTEGFKNSDAKENIKLFMEDKSRKNGK